MIFGFFSKRNFCYFTVKIRRKLLNVTFIFFYSISCDGISIWSYYTDCVRITLHNIQKKSEREMSTVVVLNKYHVELLPAFVDERQAFFKCIFFIIHWNLNFGISGKKNKMLRASFHSKLQNFLILSIGRFDAENSGGNAIDSAVIHIWNDFNQMPYNVGMAPASLQTFIAYFWIMPGNAEWSQK